MQFFNAFLKHDLAAKRVLRLDLLAFNSDEEFEAVFAQMWQLSRVSMTAPSGVRTWMHQRRMDALVRRLLTTPDSAPIRALEGALAEAEIPTTTQDLVQWFRVHVGSGVIALPMPRDPSPLGPKPTTPPPDDGRAGCSDKGVGVGTSSGRLRPLVEAGYLPPGTELTLRRGGDIVARGVVDEIGRIIVNGVAYRSPSD